MGGHALPQRRHAVAGGCVGEQHEPMPVLWQHAQIGEKPFRLAPVPPPDACADNEAEHAEAIGVPVAVLAGQRCFAPAHPPQSVGRNRRVRYGPPAGREEQRQSAHVARTGRERTRGADGHRPGRHPRPGAGKTVRKGDEFRPARRERRRMHAERCEDAAGNHLVERAGGRRLYHTRGDRMACISVRVVAAGRLA